MQCKSWWKKIKKWCKEVAEFLGIASEGYKKAKDIKDTYDAWNKQKNYQAQNQVDPNTKMN